MCFQGIRLSKDPVKLTELKVKTRKERNTEKETHNVLHMD